MPKPSPSLRAELARDRAALKAASAGPAGWGGGGWTGGSAWVDAYQTRRAPSPPELVEAFKQVVYACSGLNQSGVARTRLGLYAGTGQGQARPKCATRALRPGVKAMLRPDAGKSRSAAWFAKMATAAEVDEVAEHPLLEMIDRVNDDWDYDRWVRYAVACLDVCGWFFSLPEATATVKGKPVPDLLWPLLAQYVLPVRDPAGSLTKEYTYFGQRYEPTDLIRGRFVSLRDPYGLGYGPTQAGFAYVGLSDQYASLQENLLTQGGKISGFVSEKDALLAPGETETQKYVDRVNATWTRGASGKVVYIPGNLAFNPVSWPPSDLAALEISDNALQRIANCFGVPLSLLKTEDVNLANAEAGHRQHAELAVDPRCTLIASALTRWTRRHGAAHGLPGWDRLFWAFDNPVAEDAQRNAAIHKSYWDMGVVTTDEIRYDLGYEPLPDGLGESVTVPSSLTTLDRVVNPPDPVEAPDAMGKPGGAVPAIPSEKAILAKSLRLLDAMESRLAPDDAADRAGDAPRWAADQGTP